VRMPALPRTRESLVLILAVVLSLLVLYGPMLFLVGGAARFLLDHPAEALALAIPGGRRLDLFLHSVLFSGLVSLAALVLGAGAGLCLWQSRSRLLRGLPWFLLLLVPLPAVVLAMAWVTTGSGISHLLSPAGPGAPLQGWAAAWWVEVMLYLPVATLFCSLAFRLVDPDLIDAGRVAAPDLATLGKVILPLASPFLSACAGFLFVFSLVDYTIPSLFSVNVYALEIFAEYSASGNAAATFLLAVPLLAAGAIGISFGQLRLFAAFQNAAWRTGRSGEPFGWPGWFRFFLGFSLVILLADAALLLGSLLANARAAGDPLPLFIPAMGEILFSLGIALGCALLVIPVGLTAGYLMASPGPGSRLLWLAMGIPLAIPAALTGVAMIGAWNTGPGAVLYGTIAMPVLACAARFGPIAALILCARFRTLDPLLLDAARVFRTGPVQGWWRVTIPLALPGILASAWFVLSLSLGELGATLLLTPPGYSTLTLRLYNYLHYGATQAVAVVGLLLALLVLTAGIILIIAGYLVSLPRHSGLLRLTGRRGP